jgi:hypothetical protein
MLRPGNIMMSAKSFARFRATSCIAFAVTFALLASPALAQGKRGGGKRDITDAQTLEKRAKNAQVEKDYQAALDKIPDQKQPTDPWGAIRSADQPKAKTVAH